MTLVVLASGWTAGILLAPHTPLPAAGLLPLLASALLLALTLRLRSRTAAPALALALFALGALRVGAGVEDAASPPIQTYNREESIEVEGAGADDGDSPPIQTNKREQSIEVEGVVVSDPDHRSSGWRLRLSVERVRRIVEWSEPHADEWLESHGSVWRESHGGLLATVRPHKELSDTGREPLIRYGDRLILTGEVEQPERFQDFDYRDYLKKQGIQSVMLYPNVKLDGEGEGSLPLQAVYRLRYSLSRGLAQSLSEPQGAMARAIVLGLRSSMPAELTRAFRETGTSHLLAISGLHVGVFLAMSLAVSRWALGARGHLYVLAPLAAVWVYAVLTGMSPSVQRAAIMGSVYLAGLYLGRQNSGMPALAAAGAVMAGVDPAILGRVSFQLSFAAMAGLVLLAPPIEARLLRALNGGADRAWSRELAFAVAASIAATLATLPLVAYYFNYVSLVSLPATLLAMPAMPAALGAGLLTAALAMVDANLARPAAWLAWLCLTYLKEVVELFDAIPGSAVRVSWMGAPLVAAYYAALAGAMLLGRGAGTGGRRRLRWRTQP